MFKSRVKHKIVILLLLVAILLIATISYLFLQNYKNTFSYKCENGNSFSINVSNPKEIKVTTSDGVYKTYPLNYSISTILVYGDSSEGYTFVGGYAGQIIMTDRSDPISTICVISHPKNIL
jgi:hypothetical protein